MILSILENKITGKFHPVMITPEITAANPDKFPIVRGVIYTHMVEGFPTYIQAVDELSQILKKEVHDAHIASGTIPWDGKNRPAGMVYFETVDKKLMVVS